MNPTSKKERIESVSIKIKTNFIENGVKDLYFKNINEGTLLSYKDQDNKLNSVVATQISPQPQFTNSLGKKRSDPTLIISVLLNLNGFAIIVWDMKKKKHYIIPVLSTGPFEIIEITNS